MWEAYKQVSNLLPDEHNKYVTSVITSSGSLLLQHTEITWREQFKQYTGIQTQSQQCMLI